MTWRMSDFPSIFPLLTKTQELDRMFGGPTTVLVPRTHAKIPSHVLGATPPQGYYVHKYIVHYWYHQGTKSPERPAAVWRTGRIAGNFGEDYLAGMIFAYPRHLAVLGETDIDRYGIR
jgi:hypothetical protein